MGKKEDERKELVITNGSSDDDFYQFFARTGKGDFWFKMGNESYGTLFDRLKTFTDAGYSVRCMKGQEAERFMYECGCQTVELWRYDERSFFSMGGSAPKAIRTRVTSSRFPVVELHKGFLGIVVPEGKAKGVYEFLSGGLVGNSLEDVNRDIDSCGDLTLMQQHVQEGKKGKAECSVRIQRIVRPLGNGWLKWRSENLCGRKKSWNRQLKKVHALFYPG